jgi:hypothetical protein
MPMISPANPYFSQVQLLVRVLPFLTAHPCFALKGGTAINLFVRDLPRLSVDIDLTYLPVADRDTSLKQIHDSMLAIQMKLQNQAGYHVSTRLLKDSQTITRLVVEHSGSHIKVEVSPVLRGSVHPPTNRAVTSAVEQHFGFVEAQLLDFNDLYAGKICAALDRQHPRDLYDVKFLLDNEGINQMLKDTFLVYLLSHPRPIAELLAPNRLPLESLFETEFSGMTIIPVTLEALYDVRERLIGQIHGMLTDQDKAFLMSVKQGAPDWASCRFPQAQYLPAVRWKLYNIDRMKSSERQKAAEKLAAVLNNNLL